MPCCGRAVDPAMWCQAFLATRLAGAFVAAAFAGAALAGAALAGAFFAATLAGAALAGATFFAGAALVAAAATLVTVPAAARPPARAVFGSLRGSATTSLNEVPALKRGTEVFLMRTLSPVRGLRPVRAARAAFSKVPKPVMPTL